MWYINEYWNDFENNKIDILTNLKIKNSTRYMLNWNIIDILDGNIKIREFKLNNLQILINFEHWFIINNDNDLMVSILCELDILETLTLLLDNKKIDNLEYNFIIEWFWL